MLLDMKTGADDEASEQVSSSPRDTSSLNTADKPNEPASSDSASGDEDEGEDEAAAFYWDKVVKVVLSPRSAHSEVTDSTRAVKQEDDDNYLGEDVFKVEEIRDRRRRDGEIEYLIKWEGWPRYASSLCATRRTSVSICS